MAEDEDTPRAEVQQSRLRGRISAIWLFPIVALAIGIGLLVKTVSQLGPKVVVLVEDASGLSADEATVRYRDMEMGVIEEIDFTEDLTRVKLTLRLHPVFEPFLTDDARFWVTKPRISLTGISGLETLVSCSYVSFSPGTPGGTTTREFEALKVPPISVGPGTRYLVEAAELGGLQVGDAVYYRGERVGTLLSHRLKKDSSSVGIVLQVDRPYDRLVRTNSVFWNTSGLRLHLGWHGVDVETPTFAAALSGGISFATPDDPDTRAAAGSVFALHDDYKDKWSKWSPKIHIHDTPTDPDRAGYQDVIEQPDERLHHHRGPEAGVREKAAGAVNWFRDLYLDVVHRID